MKKIANLSQTYSYNRTVELEKFLSIDNVKALKCLDIITFSFHNCSKYFKEYGIKRINEILPECIIFEFDNITYLESIILYLNELKKLNVTDFFLWQDDHYIRPYKNYIEVFNTILKYYKNNNFEYLKLFDDYINIYNKYTIKNIINVDNNINIYEFDINNINCNFDIYSDDNYLMNLDIALNNIFTKNIEHKDVWSLEFFLVNNIKKYFNSIYITNTYLFDRYDIHGPNNKPYYLIYNYNIKNENVII